MMSAETLLDGGNLSTGFIFDTTVSFQAAFKVMAVCAIAWFERLIRGKLRRFGTITIVSCQKVTASHNIRSLRDS
jgi:hypothetical protein